MGLKRLSCNSSRDDPPTKVACFSGGGEQQQQHGRQIGDPMSTQSKQPSQQQKSGKNHHVDSGTQQRQPQVLNQRQQQVLTSSHSQRQQSQNHQLQQAQTQPNQAQQQNRQQPTHLGSGRPPQLPTASISKTKAPGSGSKCGGHKGGKQLNISKVNDSYALSFPNALPVKTIIWAKDSFSGAWRLCSVVHSRWRADRQMKSSAALSAARAASAGAAAGTVAVGLAAAAGHTTGTASNGYRDSEIYNMNAANVDSATGSSRGSQNLPSVPYERDTDGAKMPSRTVPCTGSHAKCGLDTSSAVVTVGTGVGSSATADDAATAGGMPHPFVYAEAFSPSDYDYYIHFLGFDRRLDQWKEWCEVRESEESLPPGEPVIREVEASSDEEHAGMDEEYLREHEEATKVKTIGRIHMGIHKVDTWYFSPYPRECQDTSTLFICEFCLSFFRHLPELQRHSRTCECRHPPGNEIYRDEDIAMFEVDGNHCRIYCENLCFLSKLFLDHKTLRHPVSLFLFYVMTEIDEKGYHITGYFSKEKHSKNNLSCLLTLPQHQRKGYGKFLINFSYSLSRKERRTGTPERPLSDLGKASYMAFWTERLLDAMQSQEGRVSIQRLSELTCMEVADVLACLEHHGMLRCKGDVVFLLLPNAKAEAMRKFAGRPARAVLPHKLHWVPYDKHLASVEVTPPS